ncbi:hypothetical protein LTS18_007380, partial [Coniosporium uncinatum]
GVAGRERTRREVVVRAKRVVVSAGTMQSPLLLLRSGLKNPHIGRHFKCHPVSIVGAVYDEEVKPWEGGILTAVVNELENIDGRGHGVKLEATTMLPSTMLPFTPWTGGADWKTTAAKFGHMVGHIALARDEGEGRVYPDPDDGRCRFQYHPSTTDKRRILEGVVALAKINYIEGAKEIFTTIPGVPTFVRPANPVHNAFPASHASAAAAEGIQDQGINDPAFNAWLDTMRRRGFPHPESLFLSAHQMGTCRMSASGRRGVVDPRGKVWGTEGLFVADASVFPSASGVNPMVTNMAVSDWISRGIARGLAREKAGRGIRVQQANL